MLILASETDAAARNIRDHLLTLWTHEEIKVFEGYPMYRSQSGNVTLATIPSPALMFDNPHLSIFPTITSPPLSPSTDPLVVSTTPDVIMYLSRHQSVSGNRSLTVHPIGNFSDAKFGGRERTLAPSAPHLMTHALRLLSEHPVEGYEVTFETTHHGPFNEIPTFFIEIGSTEAEWNDPLAVQAVAETAHQLIQDYEHDFIPTNTICIGLGGGHYAPRHTKFALKEKLDFGHMLPSYARKALDPELAGEIILKTPGVRQVCAHGKKHRKEGRIFQELGIEYIEY